MSVLERLNKVMTITTGDSRVYKTLARADSHKGSFEYNVSEFEFPEVKGTKVDRRLRKGARYPLEFYFQGDDVDEQRNTFLTSAEDTRPWIVDHPKYGLLNCHPISISWDDSGILSCRFNIEVVETIMQGGPKTTLAPGENVFAITSKANESISASFSASVNPNTSDVQMMSSNTDKLYKDASTSIGNDLDFSTYTNLYSDAISKINSAFNDVSTAIVAIQSFISAPYLFAQSVQGRLNMLVKQATSLSNTLSTLTDPNKKKIFESQKGTLISAMINTIASPLAGDYENAVDVYNVIGIITSQYNTFIDELQLITTPDPNSPDPYIPDSEFYTNLNYSVNYAVSNLMEIALSAQQERIMFLPKDTNVILVAHEIYGLTPDDASIKKLIANNKIGMDELFQLAKDRQIKYYV